MYIFLNVISNINAFHGINKIGTMCCNSLDIVILIWVACKLVGHADSK